MDFKYQLEGIINDLLLVRVETTLMLGAVLLLVAGLIRPAAILIKALFGLTLFVALILNSSLSEDHSIFAQSLILTESNLLFTGLFLLAALVSVVFERNARHSLEYYFIVLALVVGSIFLTKANNLLILYLASELVSFCSYILTGFSFKKESFEAAFKYLLFGTGSSALSLLGVGLIYGNGGFYLADWINLSFGLSAQVGLVFLFLGLFFKAAIFPMHIWVPAAYQSAPCDAVALMSVIPKLATLVFIRRAYSIINLQTDNPLNQFLLFLGIATVLVGTFSAINQKNMKRMIAFGAIAHSGFLLALVLIRSTVAAEAFWTYSLVYAIMNLAVFFLIAQYEKNQILKVQDFQIHGDYFLPISLTLVLVSLVGIPPLAGFMAKFLLFSVLYETYVSTDSIILLIYFLVAVFATVIALFYYLRAPYFLFLSKLEKRGTIKYATRAKFIATLFAIALLMLFFMPKLFTEINYLLSP